MDYQQLPSASSLPLAGGGLSATAQQHLQLLQNNPLNNVQIITSMQPPPLPINANSNIPLQVIHSLPHLTNNTNNNTTSNNTNNNNNNPNVPNNNHHNSQNLPPPAQLLQLHQQHTNNNNNNNSNIPNNNNSNTNNNANSTEEGNRWTQFQVQQLWRHHAYLNGN